MITKVLKSQLKNFLFCPIYFTLPSPNKIQNCSSPFLIKSEQKIKICPSDEQYCTSQLQYVSISSLRVLKRA